MARIDTLNNFLTDVADSIREKKGSTEEIPAANFDTEIESIPSGGGVDINDYFKTTITNDNRAGWGRGGMLKKIPPMVVDSTVTDLSSLFEDYAGTYIPSITGTSQVDTFSNMFRRTSKATTFPDIDTSSGILFNSMFQYSAITAVPNLNTSKAQNISSMFGSCYGITEMPLFDTSSVYDMNEAFYYCNNITTIPQFNTSNVQEVQETFAACAKLVTIPLLDFGKVNKIRGTFSSCPNLANVGGFQNLGKGFTVNTENYYYYQVAFNEANALTHDSLVNIINNLYDISSKNIAAQTLTLGATNLAKLTESEIKIATDKGWTVS